MVKGYFLPSHDDDAQELQLHGIYYIVYCYTTRMYRMADRLWLLFWIPLTFTNGGGAAATRRGTHQRRERDYDDDDDAHGQDIPARRATGSDGDCGDRTTASGERH